VVNAPYQLEAEMKALLPVLADVMGETGAKANVTWLAGETA
jgi:23S rRNA A2030 N6-methylase RlmJ